MIICAGVLIGCGNNSGGGGFSDRKGTGSQNILRYCIGANPSTLDPAKVQDVDTMDIINNVYEPLVSYDEQNKIVGILATEWKISSDGTVYTFKLRPSKFHDGSSVSAQDVKTSWERALSKEVSSPIADTYLGDIVGAKDLVKGTGKELTGVKVIDSATVEVTIERPIPYFLGKLTYPCCAIVPAKLGIKEIASITDAIGTGPFRVGDIKPEQVVNLKRFDDYHGEKALIEGIERKIVKDPSTRLTMYRNGETDLCTIEKQDWKAINNDPKFKPQLKIIPRPAVFYLLLGGKAYEPFKDRHVRRAVMMAINRQRITTEILKGVPIANRWLPEGIVGGKPATGVLDFNVEEAKKEMAMSPYKEGAKLPELELTIRADNTDAKFIAEQVALDLKNNLGMTVKPRMLEMATMLKARNKGELGCVFLSWYGDYIDAQNFLSMLLTTGAPANYDQWSNAEFDKICAAADLEKDATKREALYLQAESLMLQEVPRVPLYHGVDGVLVNPRVSGIRYSLIGSLPHNKVAIK
jgi:oligopeptide transport system substrate-binding protein